MSYLGGTFLCRNAAQIMVNELQFKLRLSYLQMEMNIVVVVFWDVIQCNLVDDYRIAEQPPRFLQDIGSHILEDHKMYLSISF
jgi:hypothetical protein